MSNMAWPAETTEVVFRGRTIYLIPWADAGGLAGTMYPAAAVLLDDGEDMDAGQLLISHFLSSLTWVTLYRRARQGLDAGHRRIGDGFPQPADRIAGGLYNLARAVKLLGKLM